MKSEEIFNKLNVNNAWEYKIEGYPKLLNMPTEEEDKNPGENEKDPEEDDASYEEVEVEGIIYCINKKNNTAEVIGTVDNEKLKEMYGDTLKLPTFISYNEKVYSVVVIAENAFKGTDFSKIYLSETIIKIGDGAFNEIENLEYLYIPEKSIKIGSNIVTNKEDLIIYGYKNSEANKYSSENLVEFYAIDEVEDIGDCVVDGLIYKLDKNTKEATIVGVKDNITLEILDRIALMRILPTINVDKVEYKVTTIGENAFKMCCSKKLIIENGIETIGTSAFDYCDFIEVSIPKTVSKWDITAFRKCTGIQDFKVAEDNKYFTYDRFNRILYNKDMTKLYGVINTGFTINFTGIFTIPTSVTSIEDNAFGNTRLDYLVIYNTVKNIGKNVFKDNMSDFILYVEKESCAEKYAIENNIQYKYISTQIGIHEPKEEFILGKDNYNFENSSYYFYSYSIGLFEKYLENSYLEQIRDIDLADWYGSCSGMSMTAMLFKYGYLTPSYWQSPKNEETENVNQLVNIKTNNRLMWLINFYQLFQKEIEISMKETTDIDNKDQHDKNKYHEIKGFFNGVKKFYETCDNKYSILECSFTWTDGGHSVLIIGEPEKLDENFHSNSNYVFEEYNYRIPICDPNYPEKEYIYIHQNFENVVFGNDKEKVWYGINSDENSSSDENTIHKIDAFRLVKEHVFSLEELIESGDKIKFDSVFVIRYNNSADIKIENKRGDFAKVKSKEIQSYDGNLQCTISPEIGTTAEGDGTITHNDVIFEDGDYYSIETLNDTDLLEASMQFGDSYMRANTLSGGKAIFENKKSVTLTNPSGKQYEVALTLNDEFMTLPWYTITASGKDTKDIKLEMVEEGVLVSGDNLKNLKITGNSSEEKVDLNISTDKDKVLIKANSDETKLIAFIDTDGDGTYETPLNSNKTEDSNTKEDNNKENQEDNKENDVNKGNEENNKEDGTNKENESNKNNNENNNKDNNENNNESNKNPEKCENNSNKDEYDLSNNNVKTGDYIIYVVLTLVVSLVAIVGTCIFEHF